MKKSALVLASLTAMVATLAAAQTIPAPAGSTDSGARGVVAITPVDTSSLATKTELNNAYNSAINYSGTLYNASINHTEYRYNMAVSYADGLPARTMWSRYFPGQQQSAVCTSSMGSTTYSTTFYAYIDGNGYVYVRSAYSGWTGLGYPLGDNPFYYATSGGGMGGGCYLTVAPYTSANYNGTPSAWRLLASGTDYGQP